ncbi:hypothetical protein DFH07DRAFT_777474 [Mycena maculata]|uniref:Uncharacterized protein n=1 Tax=Mycena maculata TaxID=230809 RepID=A0AAD7IJY6_9AGAR|nr:hypothetical protein DFH07DRAFT_777474 [Mycena maculata]
MFSATGLSLCLILAAILLSAGTKPAAYGATSMVFIFRIFFGIGYLPIPWLYPAEISTTRIRTRGSSISSFFSRMFVVPFNLRLLLLLNVNAPSVQCLLAAPRGLEPNTIDMIFDKGGMTDGVWGARKNGGRTVENRQLKLDNGGEDELQRRK